MVTKENMEKWGLEWGNSKSPGTVTLELDPLNFSPEDGILRSL